MAQDSIAGRLEAEAVVVGAGPAGLTAAIALASAGVQTVLLAARHPVDSRTTALLGGSVTALEALGVWEHCRADAQAMRAIRLVDARGGLLRAPETTFHAAEIGHEAFGYNIANDRLVAALRARAGELSGLRMVEAAAARLHLADDCARAETEDGRALDAALIAAADGRRSRCREEAGIAVDHWAYPQVALTCNLDHGRPHHDASTEFHTPAGPCTLVPLAGRRSSLVWVVTPAHAERLRALDDAEFALAVERQVHSILGRMTVRSARDAFPLSGASARRLAARRVALIGEAGHVFPPIGAQGFNLGLRDAATLAELVADARRQGEDIGGPNLLARYQARRRLDVQSRTLAVDLLNRSLLSDFLPLQGLRGLGMALIGSIGPLRRALMREGISPRLDTPRLMLGEPL